jgi:hypothetical protein
VALLVGLALAAALQRGRAAWSAPAFGVLCAAAAGAAGQLVLPSVYGAALAPFVPLATLAALAVLAQEPESLRPTLAGLAVAAATFLFLQPSLDRRLPGALRDTARFVAEHTAPGTPILTPVPILAVAAGRPVPPGLEMGMFGLTAELDAARAARLHLMTPARLIALAEAGDPSAIVLVDGPSVWNFAWSVPSLMPVPEAFTARMNRALLARYRRAFANGSYQVFLPLAPDAAPTVKPATP